MVFIFNEHCEMVERRVWLTRFYFEYCMSGDRKLHGFHFCYSSNYFTRFFFTFFQLIAEFNLGIKSNVLFQMVGKNHSNDVNFNKMASAAITKKIMIQNRLVPIDF